MIDECKFINNEANNGGALHVSTNQLRNTSLVFIKNSYFAYNNAGPQSSSIQFFNDLDGLAALIINSRFEFNDAKCKKK